MANHSNQPRILFVTPNISFVPACSGENIDYLNFKSSEFAGVQSNLVGDLYGKGVDVHITQPDYRSAFSDILQNSPQIKRNRMPNSRVHLTEDRAFFYAKGPESNYKWENIKISLAFQREVINYILPLVQPDLVHCHDWMTGLIPAMARISGIPCVFTVQELETAKSLLSDIEDIGIDAAAFWQYLFCDRFPVNYEETRETNLIDFLTSGIFAANFVDVAQPDFLSKIGKDRNSCGKPLSPIITHKLRTCSAAVSRIPAVDAQYYLDIYEKILQRPIINKDAKIFHFVDDIHNNSQNANSTPNKWERTSVPNNSEIRAD
jgi:starch synthase/alpha-amylase